jgi:kynureninase
MEEMILIPNFRLGFALLHTSFEDVYEAIDRLCRVVTERRFERYDQRRLTVT